ncbi:MAG: glycoside hydrolase family 2 protein, partial [Bacteroidota bacterium]|nr:glycoside hydrolase family 2 protein [Bacteroidota bacterium]
MIPANSCTRLVLVTVVLCAVFACNPRATVSERPALSATRESKPWTRWWWHGSAVTKEGLTAEMEAYQRAGIGGLEITPIYGVYGEEEKFIDFLSPKWMDLLAHVLKEAERLDLGIDMATGTGWPFGGPWVTDANASKNLHYRIYELGGGSSLQEPISFVQPPYLRMVGNNIYRDGKTIFNTDEIKITDLIDPVYKNPDLQKLAIDQIQFEKPLALKCLIGYGSKNEKVDLTDKVGENGKLDWTAPAGTWTLYAVFQGFHGKMVERAGPGGEGYVIDHFSDEALKNYLDYFDNAFQKQDLRSLRAFFNDSYEVDDARGAADFTPAVFEEFEKRQGYDLKAELPALFGKDEKTKNERVLCDYRETLSGLLLEKFTRPWKEWAHKKDAFVRNQAHGSPSNILDLYAVVDIPEIEGTEPLRFRMASSSGNVTGKKLVSAEAGTWLNEHFQSGLGDVRQALDNFMLNGVNHLVYHGTCYSPPGEPWPGRLFYASVHLNPRNPQWRDFHALNAYVTRCQSFLQSTSPDNDVLLYYPIYDRFSSPGPEMVEHFDGIGGFKGSVFEKTAVRLLSEGFGFDYISDKQLLESDPQDGVVRTSGNSLYKVILVPACNYMPLPTLEKLLSLSRAGVKVLFIGDKPAAVSGFYDLENRESRFNTLIQSFGDEMLISADSGMANVLVSMGARRERMVDMGIQCLRKQGDGGAPFYLIRNATGKYFEGWIPLASGSENILLTDPMRNLSGAANTRAIASGIEVFIQLETAGTLI